MWSYFLLLLGVCCPLGGGYFIKKEAPKAPKCRSSYQSGMESADCTSRNLQIVPKYLSSQIEVLELSFNRFREIYNESFIDLPYIKYLYLDDNSIISIDNGAFEPLQELLVLDLSLNSLHAVPSALYTPPLLWKLNLGSNPLGKVGDNYVKVIFSEPMLSLLELGLQNTRLKELPNVEVFPRLQNLNVSYNRIETIDIRQIAPLCRLKVLDARNNNRLFARNGFCDCQMLINWSEIRNITIYPTKQLICGVHPKGKAEFDPSTCFTNETNFILEESFLKQSSCEAQVMQYGSGPIKLSGNILWAVGIGVGIFVLFICVTSVYCAKRRTRHLPEDRDRSVESLTTKSST